MRIIIILIISILVVCCSQKPKYYNNDEHIEFTVDSIFKYLNKHEIDFSQVLLVDTTLVGIAGSSIPDVYVLNKSGRVIYEKPCHADFPGFLEKNYSDMVRNKPFTSEFAIPAIESYFQKQSIGWNDYNIVYFVSAVKDQFIPTIDNYLVPLIDEAKNYNDVSVIVVFSDHHEKLNMAYEKYHRKVVRNNYRTHKDFGDLPDDYKNWYKEDTVYLKGLY